MRHPSTVKKEGDLSRLTSSSSSTSTSNNGSFYIPDCEVITTSNFTSSYLPEVIDPLEWQISRKRKDRQDSTSSTTQDRKLVRSNSEEHLTTVDYEVIRRVCSHEEFKHPLQDKTNGNNILAVSFQPQQAIRSGRKPQQFDLDKKSTINTEVQEILKETHKRAEVSPARSRTFDYSHKYRISPNRDGGRNGGRNGEDTDVEHERRRSSERFCKARAQPGRKLQSSKKQSKYLASRLRGGRDENVYKYDINLSKGERRGFVSSKSKADDRHLLQTTSSTSKKDDDIEHELRFVGSKPKADEKQSTQATLNAKIADDENEQHGLPIAAGAAAAIVIKSSDQNVNDQLLNIKSPKLKQEHEAMPWDTFQDEKPIVCTRFADSTFDYVNQDLYDSILTRNSLTVPSNNGLKTVGHMTKAENLKTREIMQSIKSPNLFASPDERLKQIAKRLVALKKRSANFDETFEKDNGYRPSQADKLNDRYMKNVLAEIHKLRKEKQQLKSDPGAIMGFKTIQSGTVNRVAKMTETLVDIEKVSTLNSLRKFFIENIFLHNRKNRSLKKIVFELKQCRSKP